MKTLKILAICLFTTFFNDLVAQEELKKYTAHGIESSKTGNLMASVLYILKDPKITDNLRRLGINVYDEEGNTRDFFDILKDIMTLYKKIRDDEHRNMFKKILGGTIDIPFWDAILQPGALEQMKSQIKYKNNFCFINVSALRDYYTKINYVDSKNVPSKIKQAEYEKIDYEYFKLNLKGFDIYLGSEISRLELIKRSFTEQENSLYFRMGIYKVEVKEPNGNVFTCYKLERSITDQKN